MKETRERERNASLLSPADTSGSQTVAVEIDDAKSALYCNTFNVNTVLVT